MADEVALQIELRELQSIQTDEWYNIPHCLQEAIKVLVGRQKYFIENVKNLTNTIKQMDARFTRKEKRQAESIDEVKTYLTN